MDEDLNLTWREQVAKWCSVHLSEHLCPLLCLSGFRLLGSKVALLDCFLLQLWPSLRKWS